MLDYIIVGSGIAGICYSHILEKNGKSFFVYEDTSRHATLTAGGFFNPVILKRFTKVWHADEQLELMHEFYSEIEEKVGKKFVENIRTYRRLHSVQEQNEWFAVSDTPALREYMSAKLLKDIDKNIETPFGLGEVTHAGRVHNDIFVKSSLDYLREKGVLREERFEYDKLEMVESGVKYKDVEAKAVVFCDGFGMTENSYFNYLPMPGCKGEFITLRIPNFGFREIIKADGTLFWVEGDIYKFGTTHNREDLRECTTEEGKEELLEKLKKLINCDYEVIDQDAAVRPTVLDRRPLVGRHPEHKNLYILNGLGSRGSMLGPYTACALYDYIEKGVEFDPEMDIKRYYKKYYEK